jgi:hypothetical protein
VWASRLESGGRRGRRRASHWVTITDADQKSQGARVYTFPGAQQWFKLRGRYQSDDSSKVQGTEPLQGDLGIPSRTQEGGNGCTYTHTFQVPT